MAQDYSFNTPPVPPQKSRSNTVTIVVLVVLALLCLCCLGIGFAGWYLWTYGDAIFGLTQLLPFLI